MRYLPELTESAQRENHKLFSERRTLYKQKGFDFAVSRAFILEKTGRLKGSILEVGSGSGDTAIALAKAGYELTAVDRDIVSLERSALNLACENLLSKVSLYKNWLAD